MNLVSLRVISSSSELTSFDFFQLATRLHLLYFIALILAIVNFVKLLQKYSVQAWKLLPIFKLLFHNALSNSEFLENLKLVGLIRVFKKKIHQKKLIKPNSVLPPVSKSFEKLMQKQINIKNHLERASIHNM